MQEKRAREARYGAATPTNPFDQQEALAGATTQWKKRERAERATEPFVCDTCIHAPTGHLHPPTLFVGWCTWLVYCDRAMCVRWPACTHELMQASKYARTYTCAAEIAQFRLEQVTPRRVSRAPRRQATSSRASRASRHLQTVWRFYSHAGKWINIWIWGHTLAHCIGRKLRVGARDKKMWVCTLVSHNNVRLDLFDAIGQK